MIRGLFDLSGEETLEQLRVQGSGLQFGFDVTFTYEDPAHVKTTVVLECKNYQNRTIQLNDVAGKLASLKTAETPVDHWILISPTSTPSNELHLDLQRWKESDAWHPIRDVQFWTPDEQVQELFGLFPELYAQFYRAGEQDDPAAWSGERRREILARWKGKLAPVPHLPRAWREYLRTPRCLLTQREADAQTVREYEALYACRAPIRLLDEHEMPIDGTAEAYFARWLRDPERPAALLLGDFGDGKSFFTYVLARQLAEEFLRSPKAGWIPLRLSLRELGETGLDSRQILGQRLREFCGGISSWNEVNQEHRFLIVLDGLDEMSQRMSDTAVLRNLTRLEDLMEQFRGQKLLVTSRKMAIYSDRVRERILLSLGDPEVLHLAPVSRGDRLAFLERMADTPERKARLLKIQNTHDLLGLAAKPLFLDMMRIQLDSDDIRALDGAGIYQDYAKRVLENKYNLQLALRGDYTHPGDVRERLLGLLEELALCLQRAGTDSISLEDFKAQIHQDNLAQVLWSGAEEDRENAADADGRLTNRSLLKYDCGHPENRRFCHRSMKEYFAARGIVRRLMEDADDARRLLMTCGLSYEILEFAGTMLRRLGSGHGQAAERLTAFAHETRGKREHPQREQFSNLGANCADLLHYGGFGLPGQDWSGLLLDGAVLSGERLAHKNLSGSSLRYAHLENADLTGCDLRNCDFTGVQFEKSGQLASFAVDRQEEFLLAYYEDGSLRRWQISGEETRTVMRNGRGRAARLLLKHGGREGIIRPDRFQFWQRRTDEIRPAGGVLLRPGTQILDAEHNTVLARREGRLYVLDLTDRTILCEWDAPDDFQACLMAGRLFVLWTAREGLELIDLSGGERVCGRYAWRGPVTSLSALALSRTEGRIALGCGHGRVRVLRAAADGTGRWNITAEGKDLEWETRILETALDSAGGLYIGTAEGAVIRCTAGESGEFEKRQAFRLELKCAGALIDGVRPEEQFEILRRAADVRGPA